MIKGKRGNGIGKGGKANHTNTIVGAILKESIEDFFGCI